MATLLSAACHPIVLGPSCDGYHPDFVGPVSLLQRAGARASLLLVLSRAALCTPFVMFHIQYTQRCQDDFNRGRRPQARGLVEAASGAPCLFLQGAGGDIMPDVGMGAGPEQVRPLPDVTFQAL